MLPSRTAYPDYYEIVPHPISLREIKANVENGMYSSRSALLVDLERMFANCRLYNINGSQGLCIINLQICTSLLIL
jgi:ATP-dependent helicase STH1/SNF2